MQAILALRQKTRAAHLALERLDAVGSILRDDLSLYQYRDHLRWWYVNWTALESLERELRPIPEDSMLVPKPRAYRALEDLEEINKVLQNDEVQVHEGHICEKPDLVPSIGSWLGLVYVMHGANLGRKVIKKHLTKYLGNCGFSRGLSFFDDSPSDPQWPTVVSRLDQKITETRSIEASSEAALAVFTWLVQHGQSSQETLRADFGCLNRP